MSVIDESCDAPTCGAIYNYSEQTLGEEQCLLKCIYSMMPVVQTNLFLNRIETGENRVESKRERGRERKRENN
jgi:hypothetical protein